MSIPDLIMLPGLGADHRLFIPQLKAIEQAVVPAWIDPDPDPNAGRHETITGYAGRYARHLHDQGAFDGRYALVGFSFGGQIALEMARFLLDDAGGIPLPVGIILISAPRTSRAITDLFRTQERAARRLPSLFWRLAFRVSAVRFARAHGLDERWTGILKDMARDADIPMFRWGARAAGAWCFTDQDAERIASRGVPIFQIHAEHDPVIPCDPGNADAIVPGSSHLITWTHSDRVNDFILRAVSGR